jgi:hypothetical protein
MIGWHWKPPHGAAHYYENGHSFCGVVLKDLRCATWAPTWQCRRCERSLAIRVKDDEQVIVFRTYQQIEVKP